ncbi:MAG: hypothetical protein KME14_15150 [Tildeniella torsiva UHER 1998/13D]|jgi:hypothetical protein|nr:hypothetical protein [Tildeniella torsiva UHER 1998/13D]
MWHRFSVVLAIVVAGSVGGWGDVALSPQAASAPSSSGVESPELGADAVAGKYVQSQRRSGSGRRGMRG